MEIFLLILAGLCMLIGIIGCIVPGIPATPVAYIGLWIAQATDRVDFSWQLLLICGAAGVILCPLVGAILGELLGGKEVHQALKAGWGSFVGLLCGTILKLICCGLMTTTLIQAIW
ncbi:MAG: DUF456 domain-containing protein [Paludibacteraceae bacterium]|nr:DUF456 domain-containing protein [Paludibacteraceae bacterium]